MGLKLDMSKAYDSVEQVFLERILSSMGFSSHWVDFIMNYAQTVSFAVMVNGFPHRVFTPKGLSGKGIPYHYIYSFYMLKPYQLW